MMSFSIADWTFLVIVSMLASVALSLSSWGAASSGLSFSANALTAFVLAQFLVSELLRALAPWLILRHCVADLRLWRWLFASVLGLALGAAVAAPSVLILGPPKAGDRLLSLGGLSATQLLIRWLTTIAGCVAYYLPPGLLLQRLSGASAWPFVIASAVSTLVSILLVHAFGDLDTMWALLRPLVQLLGPAYLVVLSVATGLALGAVSGLGSGAGLFFMARRSALRTKNG
jgi:hypothetical protein